MSTVIEQSQQQLQKLNHQLIQRLNVLQMSAQELCTYIYDETVENPLIDMDALNMGQIRQKLDWLQRKSCFTPKLNNNNYDSDSDYLDYTPENSTVESLREHLRFQLQGYKLNPCQEKICSYLIDCVDPKGYLSEDPESTAMRLGVSKQDVESNLELLRSFEPAGVCAPDLKHCLLYQLDTDEEIAKEIVENHMDSLSKGHYSYIAQELNTSSRLIMAASDRIRNLSPIPSSGFSDNDRTEYLIPDAELIDDTADFKILNSFSSSLKLSSYYSELYKSTDDEELKSYLDKKLRSANELINAVSMRERTLTDCISCIIRIQSEYFNGSKQSLIPMTLQDIAQELNISQATVSRAIRGKNIQCRNGVFPLKSFFTQKLNEESGSCHSTDEALQTVRQLIEQEDKHNPLSDQQLSDILLQKGIKLSRRTVAKYRIRMGISGTYARKA